MKFQDEFDAIYERYTLCHEGEKIFGFVPKEYPDMVKHQRELALLQKLYGLYNDVMKSIDGYSEIKWAELDIQKIMAELADFQTRCRRLPKGKCSVTNNHYDFNPFAFTTLKFKSEQISIHNVKTNQNLRSVFY